jgi:hypothetical protein
MKAALRRHPARGAPTRNCRPSIGGLVCGRYFGAEIKDGRRPPASVKPISRRNGGYGPDSRPSRDDPCRRTIRPTATSTVAMRNVRLTSTPAVCCAQIPVVRRRLGDRPEASDQPGAKSCRPCGKILGPAPVRGRVDEVAGGQVPRRGRDGRRAAHQDPPASAEGGELNSGRKSGAAWVTKAMRETRA